MTTSTVTTMCFVAGSFVLGVVFTKWHQHLKQHESASGDAAACPAPRRFASAIRLRPGQYRRYRELHDNVWEAVLDRMYRSNIRNFCIYHHAETSTLYQSFEWIGHWRQPNNGNDVDEKTLFQRDMQAIAKDPVTRKWWIECEPCQEPFSQWKGVSKRPSQGGTEDGGDWWAPLECVCHAGHWPTSYATERNDPDFVTLSTG